MDDTPGERVRELRRKKGWSQQELGNWLDPSCTHAAVSDIERGRTQVSIKLADHFAAIFGVRRWDIIGNEPLPDTEPAEPTWQQQRHALIAALVSITAERDAAREELQAERQHREYQESLVERGIGAYGAVVRQYNATLAELNKARAGAVPAAEVGA